MEHQDELVPHVLLFPLPIQSPVNSMLQLAELLCLEGLHVTFLSTEHNLRRLLCCTNVQSRFAKYSGFHFETIADGLPENRPRTAEQFEEILDSLQRTAVPYLREMLGSVPRLPVTCVIAEGLFSYALDIAKQMGVPFIFFETISPGSLWTYLSIPKLIEAGELPYTSDYLDLEVKAVPGMEGFLRRRDLPHFLRGDYTANRNFQFAIAAVRSMSRADGLILNSYETLDGPVLSHIRSRFPKLYAIGPLQLLLRTRLSAQAASCPTLSNSFWEEDTKCIRWLDAQPLKSVIYVSFGSLLLLTMEEFLEFWHGIENTGQRFLWVIRPGSIKGQILDHGEFLKGLTRSTHGKGLILSWVPQEEVLAHPAIAAFLTHSGWNSTLESIIGGVPMICWPRYVDQLVTSRYVSEVWKFGLDMKDTCERSIIEKMVKDVMRRKDDLSQSVEMMSKMAVESVSQGGSSCSGLDRLVEDIKGLRRGAESQNSFS